MVTYNSSSDVLSEPDAEVDGVIVLFLVSSNGPIMV